MSRLADQGIIRCRHIHVTDRNYEQARVPYLPDKPWRAWVENKLINKNMAASK